MISKELLSAILGKDVTLLRIEEGSPYYDQLIHCEWGAFNIHSIANKCKKWIVKKYPSFSIKWYYSNVEGEVDVVKVWINNICVGEHTDEPEAIFKACQWILEK